MWWLYELFYVLGLIAYLPKAFLKKRLPHPGWRMRLGRYPKELLVTLNDKPSLWVHAVSVGEVQAASSLLPLLANAYPQYPLVVSSITPGGFALARKEVNPPRTAIYFPLDLHGCIVRSFAAFHPRVLLLMESELWPRVLSLAQAHHIPVIVVNGRISPRTFRRCRILHPLFRTFSSRVELFLMQSQRDAERLLELGVDSKKVRVTGNLKWDASAKSRPTKEEIQKASDQLKLQGIEPLLVAGSTHRGEEQALLKAFREIRSQLPALRCILAPRHLERLDEVEALAKREGFCVQRSSKVSSPVWDVALVDRFGELSRYYALSSVAFVGGSLIPHGGQNPLEPASLGRPVIFGHSMHNFAEIAHQLVSYRAARQLSDGENLTEALRLLILDPGSAESMGKRALELTQRFGGATHRTFEALHPYL
ncbi:MAG: 3-deoxy-D-manno-octulosonic acid transferase [Candidatus Omnitrophica bacterium]|nr:3-deoxy-D-manno-octulosonic acid transferase [Candidatus Omnitrophota bacterium]